MLRIGPIMTGCSTLESVNPSINITVAVDMVAVMSRLQGRTTLTIPDFPGNTTNNLNTITKVSYD